MGEKDESRMTTFNGERKNWRKHKIKMEAFLTRKRCKKALSEEMSKPYKSTVTTDASGKKTVSRSKIKEEDREGMNDKAVGYLFESLEGDAFTKVSLKSIESAYQIWQYLIEFYDNVDEDDKEKSKLKWAPKEKPENFNMRLNLLNEKYTDIDTKYTLDESEMKTIFFSKILDDVEFKMEKKIIKNSGLSKISLEKIVKRMEDVWEELYGGDPEETKKETESALNTEQGNNNSYQSKWRNNNGKGRNEGKTCRYCGKKNHIESECRGKKKDQEAAKKLGEPVMSNRICYECKEHGHLAKDCPRRREQSNNLAFEDCFSFNIEHKEMIGDTENAFNNFFDTFFKEKQCYEATPVPMENTYEDDSRNNVNLSDETSKMTKQEAPANCTRATDTECVLVTSNSNFENWLVDSEATLSIDNEDKGLTNMTRCNTEIIVGTGSKTRANKQGYRKFFPFNEDGEEIPTNLNIKVK